MALCAVVPRAEWNQCAGRTGSADENQGRAGPPETTTHSAACLTAIRHGAVVDAIACSPRAQAPPSICPTRGPCRKQFRASDTYVGETVARDGRHSSDVEGLNGCSPRRQRSRAGAHVCKATLGVRLSWISD